MPVTEEQFRAYCEVQASGKTNMCKIGDVCDLAFVAGDDLTREDCFDIMQNYATYKWQWEGD